MVQAAKQKELIRYSRGVTSSYFQCKMFLLMTGLGVDWKWVRPEAGTQVRANSNGASPGIAIWWLRWRSWLIREKHWGWRTAKTWRSQFWWWRRRKDMGQKRTVLTDATHTWRGQAEGTRLVLDTLHCKGWGIHDVQWRLEGTDKDSRRDGETRNQSGKLATSSVQAAFRATEGPRWAMLMVRGGTEQGEPLRDTVGFCEGKGTAWSSIHPGDEQGRGGGMEGG